MDTDVVMVGLGATPVMYYRVLLPAHALGCDYVGVQGYPPETRYRTGLVRRESMMPNLLDYKVVVLQQPSGRGWLDVIRALQAKGTVVVYEIDDWLHAIKNQADHAFRERFQNHHLAEYEMCMKACDAMIVATPFLASVYRSFNKRIFVCPNGIDAARYALTRPERQTVNVGWAGATGHAHTMQPWLQVVGDTMAGQPNVRFVSIGQRFAQALVPYFGEERCISVPFAAVEQYPAAMTMIDVALAPSGKGGFHKAKSDLRWLEAGALGIPIIADPVTYPHIADRVTGFHAATADAMRPVLHELLRDAELRTAVGQAAKEYVLEHRTIEAVAPAWRHALEAVIA